MTSSIIVYDGTKLNFTDFENILSIFRTVAFNRVLLTHKMIMMFPAALVEYSFTFEICKSRTLTRTRTNESVL